MFFLLIWYIDTLIMKNKKNMGYGSFSYHWHINNKLYIFISITIESNLESLKFWRRILGKRQGLGLLP